MVVKNGQPDMKGICLHSSTIDSISKIIKFIGYTNLSILTNILSIIPFGTLIDLLVIKRVVEVGFNSLRLSCRYTKYGSKLTLALRSSKSCSILWSPIMQEIVRTLASLYFKALLIERI